MAIPKKKGFIQEVVEPQAAPVVETQPEFLQEVIEPEVQVPVEAPKVVIKTSKERLAEITARAKSKK